MIFIQKASTVKPYIMVPIVLDYLGLTPHEKTLYLHYSIQSNLDNEHMPPTEELTGMSTALIQACRKSLAEKHLLDLDSDCITVLDIYPTTIELLHLLKQTDSLEYIEDALLMHIQMEYEGDSDGHTTEES